ncbi:MAG: PadR family transcriptional regulator [Acidobacteria bacterium]|nr:PadR family transcriptional regulator [Acidobacteriota bacterium]
MNKKKSDLLQGTLDLLVLKTLAPGPLHGYGIAQRILLSSRQVLDVQQGSMYPALHRLERKGLVSSEWRESENGRMAKFYSLTRAGRKQLADELEEWSRYAAAINWVLEA